MSGSFAAPPAPPPATTSFLSQPIFAPGASITDPNVQTAQTTQQLQAAQAANAAIAAQQATDAQNTINASNAAAAAEVAADQAAAAKAAVIAPTGQTNSFAPGTAPGTVGSLSSDAAGTGLLSPAGDANLAAANPQPGNSTPPPTVTPPVTTPPVENTLPDVIDLTPPAAAPAPTPVADVTPPPAAPAPVVADNTPSPAPAPTPPDDSTPVATAPPATPPAPPIDVASGPVTDPNAATTPAPAPPVTVDLSSATPSNIVDNPTPAGQDPGAVANNQPPTPPVIVNNPPPDATPPLTADNTTSSADNTPPPSPPTTTADNTPPLGTPTPSNDTNTGGPPDSTMGSGPVDTSNNGSSSGNNTAITDPNAVQALINGQGSTSMTPTPGNPDPLNGFQPSSTTPTDQPTTGAVNPDLNANGQPNADLGLGPVNSSDTASNPPPTPPTDNNNNSVSASDNTIPANTANGANEPLAFLNSDNATLTTFDPNTGTNTVNPTQSASPPIVSSGMDVAKTALAGVSMLASQGRANAGIITSEANTRNIGNALLGNAGPLQNVTTDVLNGMGIGPAQGPANQAAAAIQFNMIQTEGQPLPAGSSVNDIGGKPHSGGLGSLFQHQS
jgi:hypothetical protein